MKVLLLDGHPDEGRLTSHLLDVYERSLPPSAEVTRVAVRDLAFTPVLRHGYKQRVDAGCILPKSAERKFPSLR